MKTVNRILILLLIKTAFDCLGPIAANIFDYPSLRLSFIGIGGMIIGYLYHKWWPIEKKEGAE